jgi:hypothetical protein
LGEVLLRPQLVERAWDTALKTKAGPSRQWSTPHLLRYTRI